MRAVIPVSIPIMLKENIADLYNFMVVAEECSFTRAAAKLGVTQSALSHAIKGLELRLGNTLLARTTRKVALTETGLHLLTQIAPRFSDIAAHLNQIEYTNSTPSGMLKIAAVETAAHHLIWPVLSAFLPQYPRVKIEVDILNSAINYDMHFDAVIETGESIYKDRVTIPLSNALTMVTVTTPEYIAKHQKPERPTDIDKHACLGMTTAEQDKPLVWHYYAENEHIALEPRFTLSFNTYSQLKPALLSHMGIAYLPKMLVKKELASQQLIPLFLNWQSLMPGFYLHHAAEMPVNDVFTALVNSLQEHGKRLI